MKLFSCILAISLLIGTYADVEAAEVDDASIESADVTDSAEKIDEVSPLYLRANLLRWVTLTPDLGVEWRANSHWGVLVNSSYTSWSWDSKNRRYALWEVSPEVRCYLGANRNWYVGAMFKVESFNYKFSEIGKQGDIMGGGITR